MLAFPVPSTVPDPDRRLSVTAVPGERSGRVVVEVVGEVDTSTAPLLQLCLDSQAARRGLRELVVDLEQVTFLGAAGVTVLAQVHRRCRMRGARLVIRCAGGASGTMPLHRESRHARPASASTAQSVEPVGPAPTPSSPCSSGQ